jgi:hypothetical protein
MRVSDDQLARRFHRQLTQILHAGRVPGP